MTEPIDFARNKWISIPLYRPLLYKFSPVTLDRQAAIRAYGSAFLSCFSGVGRCRTELVVRDGGSGEFDVRHSGKLGFSTGSDSRSLLFLVPQICDTNVNKIECNSDRLDLLSTKY